MSYPNSVAAPRLLRLLVQVRHRDACRQLGEVGVLGGHVGRGLGGELVQLARRHAGVHALDHLLPISFGHRFIDSNRWVSVFRQHSVIGYIFPTQSVVIGTSSAFDYRLYISNSLVGHAGGLLANGARGRP